MADLSEIGASGLRQNNGTVNEEFLQELSGARGMKVYREMESNDPVVGAILWALTMLVRSVMWWIEPDSDAPEDAEAAAFVEECRGDMSRSWGSTVAEILSMLPYGWCFCEVVYKLRQGDGKDPTRRSRYTDGKIGWRKIERRAQTTLSRWIFDDAGGLQGMEQSAPPKFQRVVIPIDKALLFRVVEGSNPEGRSILRTAYRPYRFLTRIQEIEAIGIERDLAGLPKAEVPAAWMAPDASASEKSTVAEIQRIVTSVRRNEAEGLVWPQAHDAGGNPMFSFSLVTSGGKRQFDTDKTITRYEQRIAMSVLADVILLGHEKVGSNSLGVTKAELFAKGVEAIIDSVAEVFNLHAIPRLLALNGMKGRCRLAHGSVERVDLGVLGSYIQSLSGADVLLSDDVIGRHLRKLGGMPEEIGAPDPAQKRRRSFRNATGRSGAPVAKAGQPGEDADGVVRIAAAMAPVLREQFLDAVEAVRDRVDVDALADAISRGDVEAAEAVLSLEALGEELRPALATLRGVVAAAGTEAARVLSAQLGVSVTFDVGGSRASDWLAMRGAELVTSITEQQRSAVRARLVEMAELGESPASAALSIVGHIGQSERDSAAIARFEARQREDGASDVEVARRTERYARRKLEDRATTIAEHEALEAAGAGRQEAWEQAEEAELLPPETRRRVLVAADERECSTCDSVRHKTFGLREDIIPGRRHTPLHLKCRCPEVLVFG